LAKQGLTKLFAPGYGQHAVLPTRCKPGELEEAQKEGKLYTHHFNMLRSIIEKTASFHGYGILVTASGQLETTPRRLCTRAWLTS